MRVTSVLLAVIIVVVVSIKRLPCSDTLIPTLLNQRARKPVQTACEHSPESCILSQGDL